MFVENKKGPISVSKKNQYPYFGCLPNIFQGDMLTVKMNQFPYVIGKYAVMSKLIKIRQDLSSRNSYVCHTRSKYSMRKS